MLSLSKYLGKQFTVGGTTSNKILIFDMDDTLIYTTANIWVMKDGKHIKTLSSSEYNDYKPQRGESFDYCEFDDPKILSRERFTPYWNTLKREYKKGTHISILTARGNAAMIRKFFLQNGIDIKPDLVFAIGDPMLSLTGTVQDRKAQIISHIAQLGYDTMVFFDDNEDNLKSAQKIARKLNIKIHTIKA